MSNKKYVKWTIEMKTFVVERYLSPKSYQVAIRDFEQKFNNGKTPLKSHIE